jgi:trans-aconitate 2-methyltransferase
VWDPVQYTRYADERSRPFHELVARIDADDPAEVVDLGCGDGSLTATLAERWPGASVLGVDSSAEMLAKAEPLSGPRLRFRQGGIEDWSAERPVDVLVSNAALQWVPDHVRQIERLVTQVRPGGVLAFQVPGNGDAPSHTILADLRRSPRWSRLLGEAPRRFPDTLDPTAYLDRLVRLGCAVDAWETTYVHVLPGPDPVLQWMRGAGLRPVLTSLSPADAADFEAEYAAAMRDAYPQGPYGTPLPFRRVFVVARTPA